MVLVDPWGPLQGEEGHQGARQRPWQGQGEGQAHLEAQGDQ